LLQSLAPTSPGPETAAVPAAEPNPAWRDRFKAGLCGVYKYSGAMSVQEWLTYAAGRRSVTVLLLHRVTDEIPGDGLTVSTPWFRRLCRMLSSRFRVVPLGQAVSLLKTPDALPRRTVAITFDDCYRDNLKAARILAEHHLPACFFVPTEFIGTDRVFDWDRHLKPMPNLQWDDLHEIIRLGHDIGSHTASHADLGLVDPEQAERELRDSKKILETRLGCPVRWFAYPFGGRGNFRPEYLPLVHAAGYEACFSGYGGSARGSSIGQVIPRESVPYFRTLINLELHLSGCLDWFYGLKRRVGLQPALS
jgi:peptidoglycan/xylan/chitin deacetylase (PgdA/CDA1 family)